MTDTEIADVQRRASDVWTQFDRTINAALMGARVEASNILADAITKSTADLAKDNADLREEVETLREHAILAHATLDLAHVRDGAADLFDRISALVSERRDLLARVAELESALERADTESEADARRHEAGKAVDAFFGM